MAKVKALVSFAGRVTMAQNEIRDLTDEAQITDLLSAGYIEVLRSEKVEAPKAPAKKKEGK